MSKDWVWTTYDSNGREIGEPVLGVGKFFDFGTRDANGLHDLELVC